jgi:hypothetical protein
VWAERLDEAIDGLGTDPLGPAKREIPATQIQAFSLVNGDIPDAEIKREVRAPARGCAIARDGLKPAPRPTQERQWRHESDRKARE